MFFFCQAEDGIRDLVRSRGLGDVYKRQLLDRALLWLHEQEVVRLNKGLSVFRPAMTIHLSPCLLYTSDAADERSSVDLGGRRIIKKKKREAYDGRRWYDTNYISRMLQ